MSNKNIHNKNIHNISKIEITVNISDSSKAFILIFMGIIWREVYKKAFMYSDHNYKEISKYTLLQSLKFNIFSDVGYVKSIESYVEKALTDGFLMPQTSQQIPEIQMGVMRFKEAYDLILKQEQLKEQTRDQEILFVKSFADQTLKHNNKFDSLRSLYGNELCGCNICGLINSWDVNTDLIESDSFRNIIMKGLTSLIYTIDI